MYDDGQCYYSSAETYMQRDLNEVTDYTIDGKCSQCGGCCGATLPMTKNEIKEIKRYVKRHHIRAQHHASRPLLNRDEILDMVCPFRDNVNKICTIYKVRPFICREFICSMDSLTWCRKNKNNIAYRFEIVNMWDEFFKVSNRDKIMTNIIAQKVHDDAKAFIMEAHRQGKI